MKKKILKLKKIFIKIRKSTYKEVLKKKLIFFNTKKLFKKKACSNKKFDVFFSFKYNNFFLKKLFLILIKKGFKMKIYKMYFNWINIIKFNLISKNINKHIYIYCLLNKILPKVNFSYLYKKGKTHAIPNIKRLSYKQNLKLNTLIASWIKKSFIKRKEKTFILKFFSEMNDIRLNKGLSIKLKKEFYRDIYSNKKYYKFKKWI